MCVCDPLAQIGSSNAGAKRDMAGEEQQREGTVKFQPIPVVRQSWERPELTSLQHVRIAHTAIAIGTADLADSGSDAKKGGHNQIARRQMSRPAKSHAGADLEMSSALITALADASIVLS